MRKYRALLAVDAEGFTTHNDAGLAPLAIDIQRVVRAACEAAGLGATWDALRFKTAKGDGVLAAFPTEALSGLIDPFAARLQRQLADMAPTLRSRGARLRLRVALHVGMLDDGPGEAQGASAATNTVSRLLNSRPLYSALEESDPEVTLVALLLSSEVFESWVAGGWTSLRPSQFTEVEATAKRFRQTAYLHVPTPSGFPASVPPARSDRSTSEHAAAGDGPALSPWMGSHVRYGNLNNGVVQGDQNIGGRDV